MNDDVKSELDWVLATQMSTPPKPLVDLVDWRGESVVDQQLNVRIALFQRANRLEINYGQQRVGGRLHVNQLGVRLR